MMAKTSAVLPWLLVGLSVVATATSDSHHGDDIHGGVPMGVSNPDCDNAQWKIELDFDGSKEEYTCGQGEQLELFDKPESVAQCSTDLRRPLHICFPSTITYEDLPPMAGPHRPLWPVYGEYIYVPPQRWIHSLEHGAAVFLYHPCADPDQVETMRNQARSCMKKHIITPYRQLRPGIAFTVLTYGCRLQMSEYNKDDVEQFVREHALDSPEASNNGNGQYACGLKYKALVAPVHKEDLCQGNEMKVVAAEEVYPPSKISCGLFDLE